MRILLADETNRTPTKGGRFFVYGALILEVEHLRTVDAEVAKIRAEAGYLAGDDFKFDTRSRPAQVSIGEATRAKARVLALCKDLGAQFIVYVALHELIKSTPEDDQVLWAANTVISQYNRYLRDVAKDDGICVVDNLPVRRSWQYLAEKFTHGLDFGGSYVRVDRVKLFAATCNNASHASSVMDIVLGSFRYCINDPKNREAASQMMADVVELMWHERKGEKIYALDRGLVLRPQLDAIRVEKYRVEYLSLIDHVNSLLVANRKSS